MLTFEEAGYPTHSTVETTKLKALGETLAEEASLIHLLGLADDDLGGVLDGTAVTCCWLQYRLDFIGNLGLITTSFVVAAWEVGHELEGKRKHMLSIKLMSYRKLLKNIIGVDEIIDSLNVEIANCLKLRCLRTLNEQHQRCTC